LFRVSFPFVPDYPFQQFFSQDTHASIGLHLIGVLEQAAVAGRVRPEKDYSLSVVFQTWFRINQFNHQQLCLNAKEELELLIIKNVLCCMHIRNGRVAPIWHLFQSFDTIPLAAKTRSFSSLYFIKNFFDSLKRLNHSSKQTPPGSRHQTARHQ